MDPLWLQYPAWRGGRVYPASRVRLYYPAQQGEWNVGLVDCVVAAGLGPCCRRLVLWLVWVTADQKGSLSVAPSSFLKNRMCYPVLSRMLSA